MGDGSTHDTAAFQQALDTVGKAGGGIVFVPTGNYRIEGHLSVPQCTLSKQSDFKSVVDPKLPPGTYTVTARPVIALDGREVAGEACDFSWVAESPVVALQAVAPKTKSQESVETVLSRTIPLDSPDWRIAVDPQNEGREKEWFAAPPVRNATDQGSVGDPGYFPRLSWRGLVLARV